jgi:hypothetical protein
MQIVTPHDGLIGHATCERLHTAWTNQHVWFPEHNCAIHVRWQFILEYIPEMRVAHLYDDLTPIYEDAAVNLPACNRLFAAYDMTILQHRFWQCLYDRKMTLAHVYGWNLCAAQAWQRRLLPRLEGQKPWRRGKYGKVQKPVIVPAKRPASELN